MKEGKEIGFGGRNWTSLDAVVRILLQNGWLACLQHQRTRAVKSSAARAN